MHKNRLAPGALQRARALPRAGGLAAMLIAACTTIASASVETRPASSDRVATAQPPKAIDDFELTDQEGKPFRLSQLSGRPAHVFFGFTHCPDVCPSTLAKLERLMSIADPKIHAAALVMISVDGDRDSPAVMKAYLSQVSPRCIGLTGDPRTVRRIAAQFSGVFFKELPDKPGGAYLVEHTSRIYLIDQQRRLRATFFDASIDAIRQTMTAILDESRGFGAPSH